MAGFNLKESFYRFLGSLYAHYLRVKDWEIYQGSKKKHISVIYDKGKLNIKAVDHKNYIIDVDRKIKMYQRSHNPRLVIEYSLKQALEGCNYVIFRGKNDENKIVQFWTSNGQFEYEYPTSIKYDKYNYRLALTGLLASLGHINSPVITKFYQGFGRYKKEYRLEKENDGTWTVKANFGKNIKLAKKHTYLALKYVFKTNLNKMRIKIG